MLYRLSSAEFGSDPPVTLLLICIKLNATFGHRLLRPSLSLTVVPPPVAEDQSEFLNTDGKTASNHLF